mmetsp:Transcript_2619/g.2211  ORF Transcript_2619/g.2211 Transcript_2619/m.2211 type:complete len:86 (-) Transcript_2619:29-286(-)
MTRPRNYNNSNGDENSEQNIENEILEVVTLGEEQEIRQSSYVYRNPSDYKDVDEIDDEEFSNIGSEVEAVRSKNHALSNRVSNQY